MRARAAAFALVVKCYLAAVKRGVEIFVKCNIFSVECDFFAEECNINSVEYNILSVECDILLAKCNPVMLMS